MSLLQKLFLGIFVPILFFLILFAMMPLQALLSICKFTRVPKVDANAYTRTASALALFSYTQVTHTVIDYLNW